MPVVAVAAAVALDAGVVGTAIAGGIASIGVLSAITAIGATVSAVGAVTGNKTLTLIGGGLGIVGAIGSLAAGSGALGTVGDLFGSSAGDAGGAMAAADASAVAGTAGSEVADNIVSDATAGAGANIANAEGAVNAGLMNSTSLAPAEGNAAAIETGGDANSPLAGSLSGPSASQSVVGSPQVNAFAPSAGAGGAVSPDAAAAFSADVNAPGNDAWSTAINAAGNSNFGAAPPGGLLAWAKGNPQLASVLGYGAIQAGGAFITGLTNPMTQPQIDALNAQADQNRATAALIQRETANQGQALPTVSVTGKPASAGGLINNTQVTAPLITGAPNLGATMTKPTVTGAPA